MVVVRFSHANAFGTSQTRETYAAMPLRGIDSAAYRGTRVPEGTAVAALGTALICRFRQVPNWIRLGLMPLMEVFIEQNWTNSGTCPQWSVLPYRTCG